MTSIHDAILSKDPEAAHRAVDAHIEDASHIAKRLLLDEATIQETSA